MKIQTEFTDDQQAKVIVEFEPEVLEQYKHKAARKIAQNTRIPGFRPGKAPYNMVLNYVGEGSIMDEAIGLIVDKFYPEILSEEKLKPYSEGSLDNITSEDPLTLLFTVPLEPVVELGSLDDLKEPYQPPVISEEEVQDYILQVRRNTGTIVPLDTPAIEGDLVFFTLTAVNGQPKEGEDQIIESPLPQQVLIPSEQEQEDDEWPFKGFARKLIGAKADDEIEITYQYPEDETYEKFSGKQVVFKVKVQSVKGLQLREIDEAFLKEMGDFTNPEEMEQYIRERLEADAVAEYDDDYYNDLIDRIRQNSTIKYPPQMLEDEINDVLERVENQLKDRQMDLDVYLKIRKIDKETLIKDEIKPTAITRLERSLVAKELTKKYDLRLSEEELEHQVEVVLTALMQSGELEEVKRTLGEKKFGSSVAVTAAEQAVDKKIRQFLRRIASPESLLADELTQKPEEEMQPETQPSEAQKPKVVETTDEAEV